MTAYRANMNVNMYSYKIRWEIMYSITLIFALEFGVFPAIMKAQSF